MAKYDIRAKIGEIIRVVKTTVYADIDELTDHLFDLARKPTRRSQFRRETRGPDGQVSTVACSRSNIRSRVRLCEELGLIHFDDGRPRLFPYDPVLETGADLDKLIEKRLMSYFERNGASIDAIKTAMDTIRRRDAKSIWRALPYVKVGEDVFRQRMHLFTQVSDVFRPQLGKTFDYRHAE